MQNSIWEKNKFSSETYATTHQNTQVKDLKQYSEHVSEENLVSYKLFHEK